MKACSDKQCRRAGKKLPAKEFAPNGYCRECSNRRMRELRERKREQKKARLLVDPPKPKAFKPSPEEQIIAAIERGIRTRDGIKDETGLSEELISEVLANCWDRESIRIMKVGEETEFHIAA